MRILSVAHSAVPSCHRSVTKNMWLTCWFISSQDSLSWSYDPLSNVRELLLLLRWKAWKLMSHPKWQKQVIPQMIRNSSKTTASKSKISLLPLKHNEPPPETSCLSYPTSVNIWLAQLNFGFQRDKVLPLNLQCKFIVHTKLLATWCLPNLFCLSTNSMTTWRLRIKITRLICRHTRDDSEKHELNFFFSKYLQKPKAALCQLTQTEHVDI